MDRVLSSSAAFQVVYSPYQDQDCGNDDQHERQDRVPIQRR